MACLTSDMTATGPRLGSRRRTGGRRTVAELVDADGVLAHRPRVRPLNSLQHRVPAADGGLEAVGGPRGAVPARDARPRTVLLADLFNTQFVEVIKTEIRCFVSEFEEAVEPSPDSTRGQHLGTLWGGERRTKIA